LGQKYPHCTWGCAIGGNLRQRIFEADIRAARIGMIEENAELAIVGAPCDFCWCEGMFRGIGETGVEM